MNHALNEESIVMNSHVYLQGSAANFLEFHCVTLCLGIDYFDAESPHPI